MNLTVRRGRPADVPACVDIVTGLPEFFTPDVPDKVRGDLTAHDSWVVVEAELVVGFTVVERRPPTVAEIHWAATSAARRKQGIGTLLIEHVLDELRRGGTRLVEAKTLDRAADYEPYIATYKFWTARGFIHVDTIDPLPGWEPGNPCAILIAAVPP